MKALPEVYSNLDNQMPSNAEERLMEGNVFMAHTAWKHWGKIYYEDRKFKEEVWVNKSPVFIIEGDSLEEVIIKVNDEFGWG